MPVTATRPLMIIIPLQSWSDYRSYLSGVRFLNIIIESKFPSVFNLSNKLENHRVFNSQLYNDSFPENFEDTMKHFWQFMKLYGFWDTLAPPISVSEWLIGGLCPMFTHLLQPL